jgi:hypothetical protein
MESPRWAKLFDVDGESVQCNGPIVPCVFLKPDDFLTEVIFCTPKKGRFFN